MPFSAGTRLGPYEILTPLGAGGMGEVYRARDTRLHRTVAIKVLRGRSAQAGTRERFLREARAASALNHANICAVYDIGESDDQPYLVMEHLEGQTLRQRLGQGPLKIEELLEIGIQVASALEAAHAHKIVHRDIKASNIFLTEQQQAKVMDFGIAKVLDRLVADETAGEDQSTLSMAALLTEPGAAVGTVAYMSPEQARGVEVDARTDLFSLGVVLYEMATAASPFRGNTTAVVFDAILNRDPAPVRTLRPELPVKLEEIIHTALEKDREVRVQSAAEVRAALQRVRRDIEAVRAPVPAAKARSRRPLLYVGFAALLVLAAFGWWLFRGGHASPTGPAQFVALTNFADSVVAPSLSPDGRLLAFIRGENTFEGPGEVYVKLLPDGEPVQLTQDGMFKMGPTVFSADGARIGYSMGTKDAWTVPVLGGQARRLLANAGGWSWIQASGQRRILFSEMTGEGIHQGVYTATESRSEERRVYLPANVNGMAHRSFLSPDGNSVLIVEMDLSGWLPCRLVPFDGSTPGRRVGPIPAQCTDAAWSPDGKWMYFSANTGSGYHIWRQRFPEGMPEQVTSGATEEQGLGFSPDGRSFVTSVGESLSTLWVHDARGDRQITSEGYAFLPSFSADGKRLYYLQRSRANRRFVSGELWTTDLGTEKRERLLPDFLMEQYTVAPDGNRIAFLRVDEAGHAPIWEATLDGSAAPRQLSSLDGVRVLYAPNGDLMFVGGEGGKLFLYRIKRDGSGLQKVIPDEAAFLYDISPDGKWLAAWVGSAVAVYPVDGGPPILICKTCGTAGEENRGVTPPLIRWSRRGKFVYMHSTETRETYSVPLRPDQILPAIPADGLRRIAEAAKLPGARAILDKRAFVGADESVYAYPRVTTHRNIYRIPVP